VPSEPRATPPHESRAADPLRPTLLLVYAADGKRVFRADGPVTRHVEDTATREIGDLQGRWRFEQLETCNWRCRARSRSSERQWPSLLMSSYRTGPFAPLSSGSGHQR
jgi:hypothetical protein